MKKMLMLLVSMTIVLASCNAAGFRAGRAEVGATKFQDDEDGTVGTQPEVAVGYLFQDDLPAGAAASGWVGDAALRFSPIESDAVDGSRASVDLGTRFYPHTGDSRYQLFVGFGGTLQRLDLDDGASSATEVVPGVYGVVGVELVLGRLRWGLQYRHTAGVDAELGTNPEEQDLDGGSLTFSVGVNL